MEDKNIGLSYEDLEQKSITSNKSTSSRTSEKVRILARLAAVEASKVFTDQEAVLEKEKLIIEQQEQEQQLQLQRKQMEISQKIRSNQLAKEKAIAAAELEVYDQCDDGQDKLSNHSRMPLRPTHVNELPPSSHLSQNVSNRVSNMYQVSTISPDPDIEFRHEPENCNYLTHPSLSEGSHNDVISSKATVLALTEAVRQNKLPNIELSKFSGNDITEFDSWIVSFEKLIEDSTSDPMRRLNYLKQYTGGRARDLIIGYVCKPNSTSYEKAKDELIREFGNSAAIARAYMCKLDNFKSINLKDTNSLQSFSILLKSIRGAMVNLKHLQQLNTDFYLQKIVSKLPSYMQIGWRRHVHNLESRLKDVDFSELVDFVDTESVINRHPVFSEEALAALNVNNPKPVAKSVKVFTTSSKNEEVGISDKRETKSYTCPKCNEHHDLDTCKIYLSLSLDERRKFIFENKLCFACYKRTSKLHSAKTCQRRRKCAICAKQHPTGLHSDKYQSSVNSQQYDTETVVKSCVTDMESKHSSGGTRILLSTVLVKLRLHNKTVVTYAALDTLSSASFISKSLWQKLGSPGQKTEISIKTINSEIKQPSVVVSGLNVSSHDNLNHISLPRVYVQDILPINSSDIVTHEVLNSYPHLRGLVDHIPQRDDSINVGLLIGANCVKAFEPLECIYSNGNSPSATKTRLGWYVSGSIAPSDDNVSNNSIVCNFTSTMQSTINVTDAHIPEMIRQMYESDFVESVYNSSDSKSSELSVTTEGKAFSSNDRKFLLLMNSTVRKIDGHYELPLPLQPEASMLPNNKQLALKRLLNQKPKFIKNPVYAHHYTNFMNDMLSKGYAKKCDDSKSGVWFIPHHGVYHPHKPDKIRVVFDCSAQYQGASLNRSLLSGPDLTNSLVGVLLRFRAEPIAIMGDIEAMFYQVQVPEAQQKYLRFLWWSDGNINSEPSQYQMKVHLFGAVSSPSCANFALRQTANDNEEQFGSEAKSTLLRNFYVDDMLKSVSSVDSAISLIQAVQQMCAAGGFNLTKFISNNEKVMESISEEDRASSKSTMDLLNTNTSVERALGVNWCVKNDILCFRIILKSQPLTRRGILSTISSIYDPLGLVAPFLLKGRLILQQLCSVKLDWDEEVDNDIIMEWEQWKHSLFALEALRIPRCYKPSSFVNNVSASLHHFSDASSTGYGECSYLRLVDSSNSVHCCLIMGKSRVVPSKPVTIPRSELTAATVAVKISKVLSRELDYRNIPNFYWTDSKVVLGYINNDAKRFHVFVANRVQYIRENSDILNWNYVKSEMNPADDASRGIQLNRNTVDSSHRWFTGPDFLYQPDEQFSKSAEAFTTLSTDPEVKTTALRCCTSIFHPACAIDTWLQHFSSWYRLKKCFTWVHIVIKQLINKVRKLPRRDLTRLQVDEMTHSEIVLLKYVQGRAFSEELQAIRAGHSVKSSSSIFRLVPVLDDNGLLCVSGRIKHSSLMDSMKHPVLLPKSHHVSTLIVRHYHLQSCHSGKEFVIAALRERYWILNVRRIASKVRDQCFTCRRLYSKPLIQKMADLPADRMETDIPPFTNVGVDFFGPFLVKSGRNQLKRYGCIFTCLSIRAVHIEVAHSMEADSFINALQRFISRRGQPSIMRSDNGSNFIGAERELRQAVNQFNSNKVHEFCRQHEIQWKFNPPTASHMGGIWERQIRTVRKILSTVLNEQSLTDEGLQTLFCVTENIVNSRPISAVSDDPHDFEALSPNHLLQLRKGPIYPPGDFVRQDNYCRKRWRQVQYLADVFWKRWRQEYLPSLQIRSKWLREVRNLNINDVVLLVEPDVQRYLWNLGRVVKVYPSTDGLVRSAEIKTKNGLFIRPIHKLCLLESAYE